MEVRIESMICVWDDKIPTLFLEFVNLLTLSTSEEGLRKSVKEFAEKHELDKFFLYGFGSHHFYLHQRYRIRSEDCSIFWIYCPLLPLLHSFRKSSV